MGMPAPIPPLDRQSLADEITTLYAHINVATCRLIELIGTFDELGYYAAFGAASTAHWLSWACGIGAGAAREKVRVARALESLPQIHAAFRAGTLSYSKVRALTRVASPENEQTLVDMAGHATGAQTEKIMHNYRQALSFDADSSRRLERSLVCQWDHSGFLVIRGRLAPEQGAVFLKALERAWDETQASPPGQPDYQEPFEPVDARRADALAVLAERSLNAEAGDSTTADRFQVLVHVSAETLREQDADPDPADLPQIDDGPAVDAERARRLCCDGSVVPILENAAGEIVNIGRKTRTVPPALRRALLRRDGGCTFPGCGRKQRLHAHHLRHWAQGQQTNLSNLALVCDRHHRLVHEGGYTIRRVCNGDGFTLQFLDPQDKVVPAADDLRGGNWQQLIQDVSAETSGLHPHILIPELDWRPPDYDHIAWWMVNFMAR